MVVLSAVYYVCVSLFCELRVLSLSNAYLNLVLGFVKWYSRLYRNQGSLIYGPGPLDWSEQIVVLTGGSSGMGELLANTLAVRNVTVVVLDVNPIQTENCERLLLVSYPVLTYTFRQYCIL